MSARGLFLMAALVVGACSSETPASTPTCSAWFSGNVSDSSSVTGSCGGVALSPDAGAEAGYTLSLKVNASSVPVLAVRIDLGRNPSAGTFSSETTRAWNAAGVLGRDASDCGLSAGSGVVPNGSFRLTLSSVDTAHGTAHGTLDLTLHVKAPPATDCGVSDIEGVEIAF
jgi:hypothetical protein